MVNLLYSNPWEKDLTPQQPNLHYLHQLVSKCVCLLPDAEQVLSSLGFFQRWCYRNIDYSLKCPEIMWGGCSVLELTVLKKNQIWWVQHSVDRVFAYCCSEDSYLSLPVSEQVTGMSIVGDGTFLWVTPTLWFGIFWQKLPPSVTLLNFGETCHLHPASEYMRSINVRVVLLWLRASDADVRW